MILSVLSEKHTIVVGSKVPIILLGKGGEDMITKQKVVSLLAVFLMTGSSLFAVAPAFAADSAPTSGGNFLSNFVSFFSQKFGLDKTTVQSAMTDFHNQNKQKREDNYKTRETNRLDALVKAGKITDAQKQAIVAELAALQSKYNADSFKNLTADQKKARMQAEKAEVETWAKSQNIDVKYVFPGYGMGMGMGMGGRMRRFDRNGDDFAPSAAPTP